MQKAIKSQLKEKGELMIHDKIKNTSSLNQYYNKFKKVLLSHIDNISEYKEHIIKDFGKHNKDFVQEQFEIFKKYINTLRVGETGIIWGS